MSVGNPIKNALLGQNNPTMDDSGNWVGQILSSLTGVFTKAPALKLGYQLPGYADGTQSAPGVPARINEEGGEIVELPDGARIYPRDLSKMMAGNAGSSSASPGSAARLAPIINNFSTATVREGKQTDRRGGRKPDWVIEEAVASSLARPRGPAQKALADAGKVTRR